MSSQRAFVNARNNRRATNQGEGLSRAEKCIIARLDPNLMFLDQCSGGAAESGQRQGDSRRVFGGPEAVVGRGVLGRWVFCSDGGG